MRDGLLTLAGRERIGPGIVYRHAGAFIVTGVTRDDRQAVIESRRGDDKIRL